MKNPIKALRDLYSPESPHSATPSPNKNYNLAEEIAKTEQDKGNNPSTRVAQRGDWDTHRRIVEREQLVEDLRILARSRPSTIANVVSLVDLCARNSSMNRHEVMDYLLNNRKRLESKTKTATTRQIFKQLGNDPNYKFFFDLC